jgi:preprotein translocase subunit YajC
MLRTALLSMTGLVAIMAASASAQTPSPAPSSSPSAQATPATAPSITVGANVVGPGGNPVGTIAQAGADFAVVKTDKHEVRLPKTAFAARPEGGLVIGLSRDELNASVEQALAKLTELMKPGSTVYGTQGGTIGTIDKVEAELVTVNLASGKAVRLPKSGFAPGPQGLVVGFTVEQLEAQAAAAGAK